MDILQWIFDPENWTGPGSIPMQSLLHLLYSFVSLAIAAAIAVPLGVYIGHTGKGETLIMGMVNAARAGIADFVGAHHCAGDQQQPGLCYPLARRADIACSTSYLERSSQRYSCDRSIGHRCRARHGLFDVADYLAS